MPSFVPPPGYGVPPGMPGNGYQVYPGGSQGFAPAPQGFDPQGMPGQPQQYQQQFAQMPPPPAQFPQPRSQAPRQQFRPQPIAQVQAPQREYRGVRGDDNEPQGLSPVRIPTPEQLGVASTRGGSRPTGFDWARVHQRLKELGSVGFQFEQTTSGYKVVCKLATAEFGRSHTVEGRGATEAEAAEQMLNRAEQWKKIN